MDKESFNKLYQNTNYKINSPEILIILDERNPEIDNLLKKVNKKSWAFLSAYNPYSILVPEEQNFSNQKKLKKILEDENYFFYEGIGTSKDNSFPEEQNFLILGISLERTIELGLEFEQTAFIYAEFEFEAKLIFTSEDK